MIRRALLALVLAALPSLAFGSSPLARGFAVGGITLGGEALMGGSLALAGWGIGQGICAPGEVCFSLPMAEAGGIVGTMIGGPVAADISGNAMRAHGGRVAMFTSIGLVSGLGIMFLALPTQSGAVLEGGALYTAVAMPVFAGIAAATDRRANLHYKHRARVSVLPALQPGGASVQVDVVGF